MRLDHDKALPMFGNDRTAMRRVFVDAWRKHREQLPLQPLEQLITDILLQHPEYHSLIEAPAATLDKDFSPEAGGGNPFLHLAMHLGLQEQVASDRPQGIADLYRRLTVARGSNHEAEHELMECLGEMIWEAQRQQRLPDEQAYLECIRTRLGKILKPAK